MYDICTLYVKITYVVMHQLLFNDNINVYHITYDLHIMHKNYFII